MKILGMDPVKDFARAAASRLLPSVDAMQRDIKQSGDALMIRIQEHIEGVAQDLKPSKWQSKQVLLFGTAAVWLTLKDTAYYDPLKTLLGRLLLDAPNLLGHLDFRPPDEWYANIHKKARKKTQQLRKAGLLDKLELSYMEADFAKLRTTGDSGSGGGKRE